MFPPGRCGSGLSLLGVYQPDWTSRSCIASAVLIVGIMFGETFFQIDRDARVEGAVAAADNVDIPVTVAHDFSIKQ